jgi:hypothetical protein
MIVYVVTDAAMNVLRVTSTEPTIEPGEHYEAFTVDEDEEK